MKIIQRKKINLTVSSKFSAERMTTSLLPRAKTPKKAARAKTKVCKNNMTSGGVGGGCCVVVIVCRLVLRVLQAHGKSNGR
jgi:hypothetical protein